MTVYIEDIFICNFFMLFCSARLVINIMKLKKSYVRIIISVITGVSLIFAYPYILPVYRLLYVLAVYAVLPMIFARYKNIGQTLTAVALFVTAVMSVRIINTAVETALNKYALNANPFITVGVTGLYFVLIEFVLKKYERIVRAKQRNVKIHMDNAVADAIIDTGNRIKYKEKNVVVLTKALSNSEKLKKTDEVISVKTINSDKFYDLFIIENLEVASGDGYKNFYDIPAIIEDKNSLVILPTEYS